MTCGGGLFRADVVSRIEETVLLVVGGKDGSTPEGAAHEIAAQLESQGRRALIHAYSETGHSPFAEEPERFNRDLVDFVLEVNELQAD
jgi:non-heme chloroperoxidase